MQGSNEKATHPACFATSSKDLHRAYFVVSRCLHRYEFFGNRSFIVRHWEPKLHFVARADCHLQIPFEPRN